MRYHKRQINNQHFGIGTNRASFSVMSGQPKNDSAFKKKLRTSFMFTGNTLRKQSMSQNDPEECKYSAFEHEPADIFANKTD